MNKPPKRQSEFIRYFKTLFKKETVQGKSLFIKTMHRINRISVVMFIFAMVVIIVKRCSDAQEPQNSTEVNLRADSLENFFAAALLSENQKIEGLKKMLNELEYVMLKPPKDQFVHLTKLANATEKAIYTKDNFYLENKMLDYDSLTKLLVGSVQDLVDKIDNFEGYTRAELFYKQIMEADKEDFYLRRAYNRYASKYNQFLKQNASNPKLANFFYGDEPQ